MRRPPQQTPPQESNRGAGTSPSSPSLGKLRVNPAGPDTGLGLSKRVLLSNLKQPQAAKAQRVAENNQHSGARRSSLNPSLL